MTDTQTASRSGHPDDDPSTATSLRELIARLSDGVLTEQEASRLNVLLKEDPIAQELYLDHMLVDGLLELEFSPAAAEPSSSIVNRELRDAKQEDRCRRWSAPSLQTAVLLIAVLAGGAIAGGWLSRIVATPSPTKSQRHPLALVDRGFESGTPLISAAPVTSLWYGDLAEVVGPHSGITPLEGEWMLRFLKSESEPNDACELYQMVDLRPMSAAIATGQASVDASAFFNAIPDEARAEGHSFGVGLFAYAADPGQQRHIWPLRGTQPLSFSGRQEPADTDAGTWQQVAIRLALPADTTHLLVQVSAVRLSPSTAESPLELAGHFVDQVELVLATQD